MTKEKVSKIKEKDIASIIERLLELWSKKFEDYEDFSYTNHNKQISYIERMSGGDFYLIGDWWNPYQVCSYEVKKVYKNNAWNSEIVIANINKEFVE